MSASPSPELTAALAELADVDAREAAMLAAHNQALAELEAERQPILANVERIAGRERSSWPKGSLKAEGYKLAFRKLPDLLIVPDTYGTTTTEQNNTLGRKLSSIKGGWDMITVKANRTKLRAADRHMLRALGLSLKPQPGEEFTIMPAPNA